MDRKTFKIIPSIPFNSFHQFNSIQHYKYTNYKTSKINIQLQGNRAKSKSVITREYTITRQNQLLQFYILKAKSTYGEEELLMMKAERLSVKRNDVACCC
jgi:hypothetical protein